MTKLHETALQKIALSTGGSYVRSVSGDMDLKKIYEEEIRGKMEAGDLKSTKKRRWEERFQWFLFGSILLFSLESIFPERKGLPVQKRGRPRFLFWKKAAWLSLLGLGLLCSATRPAAAESIRSKLKRAETSYEKKAYDEALREFLDAQVERPEDILLKYDIGNTHYRMRAYDKAEESFLDVANAADPELRQKAVYNLGNCAYRQGKLEEAVAYYKQALDLDPKDEDARFNLEFVREEIKRRLNEAEEREKKEQEEKKKEGQTCQNPQSQQIPSKSRNDKKEGAGQDHRREQTQPQQQAREQKPSQSPTQGKEEQARSGNAQKAGEAREMTREEAERWLNTLDEDQKEMARKQVRKALGQHRYVPGKDW